MKFKKMFAFLNVILENDNEEIKKVAIIKVPWMQLWQKPTQQSQRIFQSFQVMF
jgi:hypothetical protein